MKIKGPGGPTTPTELDKPEQAAGVDKPEKRFAEALEAPVRTGGPAGPGGPGGADPVGRVAADLKAGRISPGEAVQKLVDLTLANGPAAKLPPRVQATLRAELENLLKDDPFLRSKLEKIGIPSGEDD